MVPDKGKTFWRYAGIFTIVGACAGEPEPLPSDPEAPGPDIYLADLVEADGGWEVARLQNATARPGYDNQPHFLPDGSGLFYTAQHEGQTDIYRIDLTTGERHRVTRTDESEYSATPMPGGETFSVVRVEADSTQRLWAFEIDGTPLAPVFERVAPVGYHAWIDPDRVALFVLPVDTLPITLRLGSVDRGTAEVVAREVGRSLHPVPGRAAVSFVDKTREPWTIMQFDPATGGTDPIAPVVDGAEDYAWAPDGSIFMGAGSRLYQRRGDAWTLIADLASHGVDGISRLAVSPDGDRLALVADGV